MSDDTDPADSQRFPTADYVLQLPLELDKYGMPTAESYQKRIAVMKNLLAAGLKVSWFTTEDENCVMVRVSATDQRLSEQAESTAFLVRSQDKYRDNYVADNETFVEFRECDRSLYSNAFIKFGPYRFCSMERLRLVHSIMMAPHDENGANMGSAKNAANIIDMFPMHDKDELAILETLWFNGGPTHYGGWCPSLSEFVPEKEIRDYFGEKIALYVVFASFYTGQLKILCPLGLLCMTMQFVDGEDTIFTPLYAVVVALWATTFLEFWKRRESSLRNQWNVEDFENTEGARPEFWGDEVHNADTEKITIEYPSWKRYCKLCVSFSVLLVLALTVLTSTLFLMVMRVVTTHTGGVPGMVIVGVINFAMIETMNKVFIVIATRMTDWENHCTQTEYDDQLIAKLFIFQFFNSYCSFFYLAFLEGHARVFGVKDTCPHDDCMLSLTVQLVTIFVMHTVLGQMVEVFWPWFQGYYDEFKYVVTTTCIICCSNIWKRSKAYFCNVTFEDDESNLLLESCVFTEEERQAFRPKFPGVLVDFNELVLQYGYVVLFAPAFPLASLLALLNNLVELRSDGYKVCKFYRRPDYVCAQDIGSWQYIIGVMSVCSVITNAAIITFTSDSLSRFNVIGRNDRLAQVVVAFLAEHVVLFIKVIIHVVIDDDPEHVSFRRQKRQYEARKAQEIEEAHETQQEQYEFRQRFVEAPDEYEFHVDI